MEMWNGKIGISHADLMRHEIITPANLKNLLRADRGSRLRVLRRGCNCTTALYEVESFPERYRAAIRESFGSLEEQRRARAFIDTIKIDQDAAAYYEEASVGGARGLDDEKRMLYTNSASILNAIAAQLRAAAEEQAKAGRRNRVNMGQYWAAMSEYLPRVADVYPHNLPENPRSLQRKFLAYIAGGTLHYEALISGKHGNKNAAKVATEEQVAWMTKFIGHHSNPDCVEVAEAYNTVCEGRGWKPVESRTVWNWAQRYGWAVDAGRYGAKYFANLRAMQVKRFAPTAPMLMWSLDGWTVELTYKKRTEGKRGGRTTYWNRLTVVVVLDPYNKYPIGYAIGYQESPALIKEALRNAANHTAELWGQRLRPVQIQSDNYQIKVMLPTYGIADYVTPAAVGNAKAKPIEPYFRRLNHKYAKKCPGNWTGYGLTSTKKMQPNLEWLNAHKGQIPEEAEVREQIRWIMESERTLKREEYVAGYAKIPADRVLPMSLASYLLNFGHETGFKNTLEGSGLNIRIEGERHTYDSFELDFRKYAHLKWNVRFDCKI